MNTYWKVNTYGDPIGAVRSFLQAVWRRVGLEAVLTSANGSAQSHWLDDPAALASVNPFRPLMRVNLASSIPERLRRFPELHLGALLRPCEMRALIEIHKHDPFPRANLTTICFDCLGTYLPEDYHWQETRKGSSVELADEALRFARQGGILAYRYRPACQMCARPGAQSAVLNIHVLGIPVRQYMLVEACDDHTAQHFHLAELADGLANQAEVEQHEHILAKQSERHQRTMERAFQILDELLPKEVGDLIAQFDRCGDCRCCLAACPICAVDMPQKDREGRYSEQSIYRWLISCAGCGMCEQVCKANLPLTMIFGAIREKLGQEFGYTPGTSWAQALPEKLA